MNHQHPLYVINMARDVARWKSMAVQLAVLGLTCERVEAEDGRLLSPKQRRTVYSGFWFRLFHGRRASSGEIGCALSHRKIYALMVERQQDWAIILEDDVLLSPEFARNLSEYERETREFDMVQFFGFRQPTQFQHVAENGLFEVFKYSGAHASAAAYGLRLDGAKKLLLLKNIRVAIDKWSWLSALTGLRCCGIMPYPVSLKLEHSTVSTIAEPQSAERKGNMIWLFLVAPPLRIVRKMILVARVR